MSKSRWRFGLSGPQVPQDVAKPVTPPALASADAKKFGLENYCNNCYVNSVVQALYFCAPFRDLMLQSPDASLSQVASTPTPTPPTTTDPVSPQPSTPARVKPERKPSTSAASETPLPLAAPIPPSPSSLFSALRSLFVYISKNPAERGTVSPRIFIDKLKELNRVFDNTTHQDAHEFLNYLLNRIVEEVEEEQKNAIQPEAPTEDLSNSVATLQSKPPTVDSNTGNSPQHATLVHKLFEGALTSETRCLTCETVSSRDESFLDLSIDIEQNSSVTACLRQFSASEMLCHKNKFFCDSCCDLQEAEKRMKIKRLPNVLALHLKRFKYQEDLQRYVKLAYRVAFPFELRLFNTVDESDDADRLYNLSGIVVHIGNGPHHGHYVSIIKTMGKWLLFDDDTVSPIAEADIPKYYGDSPAGSAYVLYYQAADIDSQKLGIRPEQNLSGTATASTTSHPVQAPTRPPGLIPEDGLTPDQAHTSSSSSVSDADPYPPPPPPSIPIIIPPKPAPPMSASTSTSQSTTSAPASSSSPSTSPLSSVLSSPHHSSSKVSVSNIIKAIRKTPSTSPRANVVHTTGRAATPSAVAIPNQSFPFNTSTPVPPLPGTVSLDTGLVIGTISESSTTSGGEHSSRQVQAESSTSSPDLGQDSRPATVHGRTARAPRALPPQPKPNTTGQAEKEGAKSWFWRSGGHDPLPEPPGSSVAGSIGETEEASVDTRVLGDVDPNTYANGGAVLLAIPKKEPKEKGKKGTWFGKRRSFRLGEKALKGLVGSAHDADTSMPTLTSTHEDSSSVTDRLRNSLQLSTRREAESMDVVRGSEQTVTSPSPADDSSSLASSSRHRSRPLSSTNLKHHLTSHGSANGDVSPPASSKSSFDQATVDSTPTTPVASNLPPMPSNSPTPLRHSQSLANPLRPSQSRPYPLPRPPSHVVNGYPASSPPRLHTSVSASPESPSTKTPINTMHTPTQSGSSGYPHTRALPHAPQPSDERKKSLGDLPESRVTIEHELSGQTEKERRSTVSPLSPLRSSAAESARTGDRPLPPVPGHTPLKDIDFHHQRQGSLVDALPVDEPVPVDRSNVGGHERSRTLHETRSPGLGTFASTNNSVASNGSGHLGFKKATRKLSLTAPKLGFGKKEKDKARERAAAPSAFAPF